MTAGHPSARATSPAAGRPCDGRVRVCLFLAHRQHVAADLVDLAVEQPRDDAHVGRFRLVSRSEAASASRTRRRSRSATSTPRELVIVEDEPGVLGPAARSSARSSARRSTSCSGVPVARRRSRHRAHAGVREAPPRRRRQTDDKRRDVGGGRSSRDTSRAVASRATRRASVVLPYPAGATSMITRASRRRAAASAEAA